MIPENIYNKIIQKALSLNRKKGNGAYFERHHIIPKCLGGSNLKENLVLLTAKEHYICHLLLIYMYPENNKIAFAFWNMCRPNNNYHQRHKVSARTYEHAKSHLSNLYKSKTAWNKGKKLTPEQLSKHVTKQVGFVAWNKGIPSKYKGIPREKSKCIHCGKEGGSPQIKQWHNDNCKILKKPKKDLEI